MCPMSRRVLAPRAGAHRSYPDLHDMTGSGHQRLSLGLHMIEQCNFAYDARCAMVVISAPECACGELSRRRPTRTTAGRSR
jgi:hypothetical protein